MGKHCWLPRERIIQIASSPTLGIFGIFILFFLFEHWRFRHLITPLLPLHQLDVQFHSEIDIRCIACRSINDFERGFESILKRALPSRVSGSSASAVVSHHYIEVNGIVISTRGQRAMISPPQLAIVLDEHRTRITHHFEWIVTMTAI